ncbi:SAFF domain-containing protein [Pleurostoma richardsiae]|uniref:SAFF domain-containing protein n=1 Tax=Pleurostoma richardsiae TaxID=41990 RepID=A0AA38VTI2_9PEZI|nr:SAFF domain-containing protein [Pleurostoma richardsiae]
MDDLSRAEYPAMLANLQPTQAVQALNDRVKRIAKINSEIADWLQERRKVEEQYVAALRKLLLFRVPNSASELGVFQPSWDKILHSTDSIAASHHLLAQRIEKDVEVALRNFQGRREMQNMHTMSANLSTIAKELEEAQERADKLTKKGGKASTIKVDTATAKLESASQQWESQAPFIFETLQALDEQRCNHLRDVLTQLQTHEVDHADRLKATANDVLNTVLEISTPREIETFAQRTVAGRPKLEQRRTSERAPTTRQSSFAAAGSTTPVPPSAPPAHPHPQDDAQSNHSGPSEEKDKSVESKLRSRIGTMLGRRRQSIHGGFGPLSPQKGHSPFGRNLGSSHGRSISPRASSQNLAESNNRLPSLAETDTAEAPSAPGSSSNRDHQPHDTTTNGVTGTDHPADIAPVRSSSNVLNGATAEEIFDAPPPPGPPPSHIQNKAREQATDADGFTIPQATNDPISQAQRDAAAEAGEEHDQPFKLSIQSSPVAEEDPQAKQAALSNVTNALSTMGMPSRKTGTIRGRRDVRNTIYVPSTSSLPESSPSLAALAEPTQALPPSPALPVTLPGGSSSVSSRPSAFHALTSEASVAGTSDTQSVRSGASLGSLAHGKHPEMSALGLNSSIVESVSATFEDGTVKTAKISGEIAFAYNADGPAPAYETIRINNFPALEVIGPNRIFVSNTPSEDEFTLDLAHLPPKAATPAFTYRLHADDPAADLASHCPLVIKTAWKPLGDKLGLLLQYGLNPDCHLPRPVVLRNLFFIATYENARASGVQTKPAGTHLKDKHIVFWKLGDVTLAEGADWSKIVCRIIGAENAEPKPGHVEARWEYTHGTDAGGSSIGGISVSRKAEGKGKGKAVEPETSEEDDPFADDTAVASPRTKEDNATWADVPLARKLVSGRYEAK